MKDSIREFVKVEATTVPAFFLYALNRVLLLISVLDLGIGLFVGEFVAPTEFYLLAFGLVAILIYCEKSQRGRVPSLLSDEENELRPRATTGPERTSRIAFDLDDSTLEIDGAQISGMDRILVSKGSDIQLRRVRIDE